MDIREDRQRQASNSFVGDEWSLIKAAPRFGKIKVTLDILNRLKPRKVLIVYPRVDIETGWSADIKKWNYTGDVSYSTFRSLEKVIKEDWDFVVIDEIHEASQAQLKVIKQIKVSNLLALSGTVTNTTERQIYNLTGIMPCYEYTIEQAVEEGILCDYQITIHKVPLDDKIYTKGKTEKRKMEELSYVYKQLKASKKDTFHIYLKQIQLIQGSHAKREKTIHLLQQWESERVLVFCGTTEMADALHKPVYHSKAKEKEIFTSFCNNTGAEKHMVTIKMAQAGITIVPISKGLVNYASGNPEDTAQKLSRFLGLEYSNLDKKADLHIVVSDTEFELSRIKTALMFFDENKIQGL